MDHYQEIKSEIRWIPDGFHFHGPEKSVLRRRILNKITDIFLNLEYKEVFLPEFDYSATFTGHLSEGDQSSVLKSKDYAGSEISPSADLTIQVVKGIAGNHIDLTQKIFYTSNIVKDNKVHNGRRRQTLQAGAEVIGNSDIATVKNLINEINSIVKSFNIQDEFVLVIGNTEVFKSIAAPWRMNKNVTKLFYSKDWTRISKFLKDRGANKDILELFYGILFEYDSDKIFEKLDKAQRSVSGKDSLGETYTMNIENIVYETKGIIGQKELKIYPDFSLVRDLDYYTGYIFQGYLKGHSLPLVTGGVYNQLYEKFNGIPRDACGFAMNLDLLEEVLEKRKGY